MGMRFKLKCFVYIGTGDLDEGDHTLDEAGISKRREKSSKSDASQSASRTGCSLGPRSVSTLGPGLVLTILILGSSSK